MQRPQLIELLREKAAWLGLGLGFGLGFRVRVRVRVRVDRASDSVVHDRGCRV